MSFRKKVVLLGDSAVGKTSLIRRFVFDQFEDSYISTVGTKVTLKDLRIQTDEGMKDVSLMIWDLIGREGYHSLHARSFEGVHGAILVADMTRQETLEGLERYWIPSLFRVTADAPLVFACNKSDLKDEYAFEYDDLVDLASRHEPRGGGPVPGWLRTSFPTSAKDGSNVEKLFTSLGHLMMLARRPDPLAELVGRMKSTAVHRTSDRTTPLGALDAIVVDFCDGFEDYRLAMPILRQEIARAGIDMGRPDRERILRLVEYLAEAESEFKDEKNVAANLRKRLRWAEEAKA